MTRKNILFSLALLASLSLAGCSAGETPKLPNAQNGSTAGANAPSSDATSNPSESAKPKDDKGSASTPTSTTAPVADKEPAEGVKPMQWSNEPIVIPHPTYKYDGKNEPVASAPKDPAVSQGAFDIYVSYQQALKAKDWAKACGLVSIDPKKGLDYCLTEYAKQDWSIEENPNISDYTILQETVSGSITMQKKISGDARYMDRIRFVKTDGGYKLYDPFVSVL